MALDLGMKNGFRAISFEYIGEFDSYFIHRYIIRYRPSLITDKIHQLLSELWPLISVCEIGFQVISFEYIGEFDSYFIHRYIIIKYRPSAITDKIHQLLSELWPLISVCEIGFRVISFEYIGILDSYTEQQKKRIFCMFGIVYKWGLNSDLMICKVSLMYGTCVLSKWMAH